MSIAEIEKMSRTEKLKAMEALWDSLCQDTTELNSPDWHEDVLSERRRKMESGEAQFVSLEEAKRRLQE